MTLQWIPSHCDCDVGNNEEADRLSKMGSKLERSVRPMFYSEAKTILRNNFRTVSRQRLDIETASTRWTEQHVTVFRLRTGHCQLLSHLHRLKISHSDECSCDTGPQTPNHILQSCPTFDTFRRQTGAGIAQLVVLGLAVHSVAGSILLWGHFPVEGIFPLELTWVQTPFPQKLLLWSSLCTHAFHRTDPKNPDVHVLDG